MALLHLRLTNEDWSESFRSLTRSELGTFFYIRTLDPYGDRDLDINTSVLSKKLGIHRTSISRALESLSQKGLIEMEIQKAKVNLSVNNRKLTLLRQEEDTSLCADAQACAPMHTVVHPCTSLCADAQVCAPTHTVVHPCTNQELEPLSSNGSSSPHTIHTYSDFIKTLSQTERENFLIFSEKKISKFSFPIANIHNYLAAKDAGGQPNYLEVHRQFLASPVGREARKQAIAVKHDFANHPDLVEHLWAIYKKGDAWMHEKESEREFRRIFFEWAYETEAFEGVCY